MRIHPLMRMNCGVGSNLSAKADVLARLCGIPNGAPHDFTPLMMASGVQGLGRCEGGVSLLLPPNPLHCRLLCLLMTIMGLDCYLFFFINIHEKLMTVRLRSLHSFRGVGWRGVNVFARGWGGDWCWGGKEIERVCCQWASGQP